MSNSKDIKSFEFFVSVAELIEKARRFVGRTADLTMCVTYYELGRMIVEEEQSGKARAEYGKRLLKELSSYLKERFGRGFSETNLKNARTFYQVYSSSIRQIASDELENGFIKPIQQRLFTELSKDKNMQIRQTLSDQSYPFNLSWSHYLILMRIKNEQERRFYEIEATKQQWTYEQLQRQYGSSLYERLALSRDKSKVKKLANEGYTIEKPSDLLKNPLILEFTGLEEKSEYSEDDLEKALISKIDFFFRELGKGFFYSKQDKNGLHLTKIILKLTLLCITEYYNVMYYLILRQKS